MRTHCSLPILSITLLMLAAFTMPVYSARAVATYQGSIQIRSRICPAGALNLSAECTQKRGPMGTMIVIDESPPKAMDGTGNISFEDIVAGNHLMVVKVGPYAERYREMRAVCSQSVTGIYPSPAIILQGETPRFRVRLVPGSRLTCNLYFVP